MPFGLVLLGTVWTRTRHPVWVMLLVSLVLLSSSCRKAEHRQVLPRPSTTTTTATMVPTSSPGPTTTPVEPPLPSEEPFCDNACATESPAAEPPMCRGECLEEPTAEPLEGGARWS